MKTKWKITWIVLIVLIGLSGAYGGYYYKNSHPVPVAMNRRHRSKGYLDYSWNGRIGHNQLINNSKRVPKLKLAKSVVAMDANTGRVIYQRNADQPRQVASISKLMTLFLVERKANQVPRGWSQIVNTDDSQLKKMGRNSEVGGFKFQSHHRYTVKDLFQAALIKSSNNAAIALGQWVAGNNRNFVKMMNQQARIWHLKAHFVSASGLENNDLKRYGYMVNKDPNGANWLSARSVAIIAQHLLVKYPSILKDSKQESVKINGQTVNNLDNLLPGRAYAKPNLKVDGLKTGFTPRAGYCFVGTEQPKRHQDRIITVVLHDEKEFTDTRTLMNYLYRHDALLNRK